MVKFHPIAFSVSFIVLIWIFYFINCFVPINDYGLIPRTTQGLIGIVSMPFLHENISHIMGNTITLSSLLIVSIIFHNQKLVYIVPVIIVSNGILLWLIGRDADHIGASGLIYGLASFLIMEGILNKKPKEVLASLVVLWFYGSSLIFGILPTNTAVSWEGHLTGLFAGIIAANIKD